MDFPLNFTLFIRDDRNSVLVRRQSNRIDDPTSTSSIFHLSPALDVKFLGEDGEMTRRDARDSRLL